MNYAERAALEEGQHQFFRYLRGNRVHHALILISDDKAVRTKIAKSFASFVLCQNKKGELFCGKCSSCKRIEKEIHPDVFTLKEEEEDTLKIEVVRNACHQMEIAPLEGVGKVCIIEDCHRLNSASANAFLKTLEEPLPGRYFLLLTHQPSALLPTITSRCLEFSLKAEGESGQTEEDFTESYTAFLVSKSLQSLQPVFSDKKKVSGFVRFLQMQLHKEAMTNLNANSRALSLFEKSLELESRLRTNANGALLLEDFIRQNWSIA